MNSCPVMRLRRKPSGSLTNPITPGVESLERASKVTSQEELDRIYVEMKSQFQQIIDRVLPGVNIMDASPPNESLKGNAPTPRMGADGVGLPDHRFDQSKAKQARIPVPMEPGEGAIPVEPYTTRGLPNQAGSLTDMIKPRPRPMK